MPSQIPDIQQRQLSEFIAETTGLHFPPERWADLRHGLDGVANEFGFEDIATCADWLLSAPLTKTQHQVLASHLTIGETYFFREKKTFDVLASRVFSELIRRRRGREQRLRIWSAGCCTGEEPYSLAILLHQVIPDLPDWHVTILATDINARFLQKAVAGSYGEWSFRDAPMGFKERYFERRGDGRYSVVPKIKEMVTFAHLNLVEDVYPALATDTNAMDLIFCRNVLMYFTPAQTRRVIANLHHALIEGGWLAVSPSEASQALFPQFVTLNLPGVILYQKSDAKVRTDQPWTPPTSDNQPNVCEPPDICGADFQSAVSPACAKASAGRPISDRQSADQGQGAEHAERSTGRKSEIQIGNLRYEEPVPPQSAPAPLVVAASLYEQGRYAAAVKTLLALCAEHTPEPEVFSLLARALANQGKLADALAWCDRWIATDKLNSAGHYLRAVVLQERGDNEQARRSLQRAVYLCPDFVLAHFALGNLARAPTSRRRAKAKRQWRLRRSEKSGQRG